MTDFLPTLRAYVKRLGGTQAFADRHQLNHRTAQRIFSGDKPCMAGLRIEILEAIGMEQERGK